MNNSRHAKLPTRLASRLHLLFTVNLLKCSGNALLVNHIDALNAAIRIAKQGNPLKIHVWVELPDHVHCVIKPPQDKCDFVTVGAQLTSTFPNQFHRPNCAQWCECAVANGVSGKCSWNYSIRDEKDFVAHRAYIHSHLLKHGIVKHVAVFDLSPFSRCWRLSWRLDGW